MNARTSTCRRTRTNARLVALAAFALAASALLPGRAPAADDAGRGAAALRGTWACKSAVIDGKPLPEKTVKELQLTITADRYKTERGDEVLFDSTYRLDPSKDPKQIDLTGTEGDLAGKDAPGVYAVDGDTLRICYVMPGRPRPKSFDSPAGSKAHLVTWVRSKKNEAGR